MVDSTHNGGPPIDDDRVGNWFAVSREIFSHPIVGVGDRSYTDLEAWLSLLAMASYEPRRAMNKGTVIVLDPGDLMAAHSYLATRWKWTADKVRWFLKRLQNEAMITRHCANHPTKRNTNQIQIVTICNYSKYQLIQEAQHQAKSQASHQANTKPTPSQHQEINTLTSKHLEKEDTREREITIRKDQLGRPIEGPDADVIFEGGTLTLVNGLRSFWLKRFDGNAQRLDLALIQAAGFVQPNSVKPIAAQVSSQLAKIAGDKVDKDHRYAAAATKPSAQRPKNWLDEKNERTRALMDSLSTEAKQ